MESAFKDGMRCNLSGDLAGDGSVLPLPDIVHRDEIAIVGGDLKCIGRALLRRLRERLALVTRREDDGWSPLEDGGGTVGISLVSHR
ncbi:hypothetical protein F2Q69_00021208 [Brassica cretica]|uniref:Uncharacterized protein n=1 Tax=Brassica cretica TaxID=69181 RepID=A0A8S9QN32_BRACR|nr:hypothetical protein F2Q69_00021208 [Brassica cretica]